MATTTGSEYDHITISDGTDQTVHYLKDNTARADIDDLKSAVSAARNEQLIGVKYTGVKFAGSNTTVAGDAGCVAVYKIHANDAVKVALTASSATGKKVDRDGIGLSNDPVPTIGNTIARVGSTTSMTEDKVINFVNSDGYKYCYVYYSSVNTGPDPNAYVAVTATDSVIESLTSAAKAEAVTNHSGIGYLHCSMGSDNTTIGNAGQIASYKIEPGARVTVTIKYNSDNGINRDGIGLSNDAVPEAGNTVVRVGSTSEITQDTTITFTNTGNYNYCYIYYSSRDVTLKDPNDYISVITAPVETFQIRSTASTDCNDYKENGVYPVNSSYSNTPDNMGENGAMFVFKTADSRLCQIMTQNAGTNNYAGKNHIWYRTVYGSSNFSKWLEINSNTISIAYVSTNTYQIRFGKYTVNLYYTEDAETDRYNWNLGEIKYLGNTITAKSTDILGPIKISGDDDFLSGTHGSSTTTTIKVYVDGVEQTLNSSLNTAGDKIIIMMVDECRRTTDSSHVVDRYVTIEITHNKIHVQNTFKNVSGSAITVNRATNGGLMSVLNSMLVATSMNNLMLTTPPTTDISNKSQKNTHVEFVTTYGTVSVDNIMGHEEDTYRGFYHVFTNESSLRTKSYFDIITSDTEVPADGIIAGEFEFNFT